MIDLKQEMREFGVINLKDISQNESEIPDNIRNSVFLYNKAIESLRTGSEDIAIIELKKAISMNPHFYEAMNLLGICYGYVKDNARATEMFNRVIKAEQNSVKALRYLSLINNSDMDVNLRARVKSKKPEIIRKHQDEQKVDRNTEKPAGKAPEAQKRRLLFGWLRYAAFFAAGLLVAFLIQGLLAVPGEPQQPQDDNNVVNNDTATDEYKLKYEKLSADHELLKKDLEEASASIDSYMNLIKLYEVESLASKKQPEQAAELLLMLKTVDLQGEEKARFDSLYGTVMPAAAKAVYEQGYKLYNTKKYEESIKNLSKVEIFYPEFNKMDAALYYMAKDYQLLNDAKNAIILYQRLVDEFPESSYVPYARSRIKTLTQLP